MEVWELGGPKLPKLFPRSIAILITDEHDSCTYACV